MELLITLKAPKSGLWILSEYFTRKGFKYTLATRIPFPRPFCSCMAFLAERKHLCELHWNPPVYTAAIGRSWPITSMVAYLRSHPTLMNTLA